MELFFVGVEAPDDKADNFFDDFTGVLNNDDARDDDGDVTFDLSAFFCAFSRSLAAEKTLDINQITQKSRKKRGGKEQKTMDVKRPKWRS